MPWWHDCEEACGHGISSVGLLKLFIRLARTRNYSTEHPEFLQRQGDCYNKRNFCTCKSVRIYAKQHYHCCNHRTVMILWNNSQANFERKKCASTEVKWLRNLENNFPQNMKCYPGETEPEIQKESLKRMARCQEENKNSFTSPEAYLSTSAWFLPVICFFHMFVADGSGKPTSTAMLGYPPNLS